VRNALRTTAVTLAVLALAAATPVCGEEAIEPAEIHDTHAGASQLAADFNDPLTTLPQLFVQNAYTPVNYGTEAPANRVIARLIVPRIPRFSLFPFVQLIRPSVSLVTVPTGPGKDTRTEFGDMALFDLLVPPWPGKHSDWITGLGPIFIFPTATDRLAGQGAWQVGPAFAAIYKGRPGLLLGCLLQNPISFAYTSSDRRPLSTLLVQPIIVQHVWRGLYVKSADATWAFGWHEGAADTLPLSLGVGYVIPRGREPALNFFSSVEWLAYRNHAPVAPQTTVRIGMTVAFPGLRLW
jgi:hypothetical protein